ncbi:MAG: hypothetical protein Q4F83_10975 [Eubacteriales bacterium]|nr:hypothetical protein [Eubacteriales bacterium]
MRVISQDGLVDVPYEMTVFRVVGEDVRMNMAGDTGKGSVMAQYSTQEKASCVMEKLREHFDILMEERVTSEKCTTVFSYFQFPEDDEVEV